MHNHSTIAFPSALTLLARLIRGSRPLLVALILSTLMPAHAVADSAQDIESLRQAIETQQEIMRQQAEALEQQRQMIEQQAQELEKLTDRLEEIEQTRPVAEETVPAVPEVVDDTPAGTPSETLTRQTGKHIELYGFTQLDAIYDFGRVDPNWEDAFRPSRIPTTEGVFGDDGQTSLSVKQTRFGVKGAMPTGDDRPSLEYKFEFDLFGVGADEGQTTFRLRHAYGEWGSVLAGQTHSLFMDINVFPNTIDYWGPSGMVFLRNPQIRWTPWRGNDTYVAVALERPSDDIDAGQIRVIDPELGQNLQGDEKAPDVTARWRKAGDWGHVQVGGILRRIGFDTRGTADNEPKGSETGWGLNLSVNFNMLVRDRLIAQVVYGEGIASYMNDGGTDLAPGSDGAEAVPLTGVVAYYDHHWNRNWSSAIGYSFTEVDNTEFQENSAFKKGQYASVNLLHYPGDNMMVGGELLYGKRTDADGRSGDDVRFQFSLKYSFSSLQ